MSGARSLRILVTSPQEECAELIAALADSGCEVTYRAGAEELNGEAGTVDAILVVDDRERRDEALRICHRIRTAIGDRFVPVVYVAVDAEPGVRLAGLQHGADAVVSSPADATELLAQVGALARIKERHDRLAAKAAEAAIINKRLQEAYEQLDRELELASRLQASFLPQRLPKLPGVDVAVYYRPHGRVGGDFYDVFRLDEEHIGLYVADVVGHGVPAGLLTIYVKKAIQAKEIHDNRYRLVPPAEVLARLNADLIEQQLSEQPFITIVYGLYNVKTGSFTFARAGHPPPLYIAADGTLENWRVEGTLLGVFETDFAECSRTLEIGGRLLLYTDGAEGKRNDANIDGLADLIAAARKYRGEELRAFVEKIGQELTARCGQGDDLTLLALERFDVTSEEAR